MRCDIDADGLRCSGVSLGVYAGVYGGDATVGMVFSRCVTNPR